MYTKRVQICGICCFCAKTKSLKYFYCTLYCSSVLLTFSQCESWSPLFRTKTFLQQERVTQCDQMDPCETCPTSLPPPLLHSYLLRGRFHVGRTGCPPPILPSRIRPLNTEGAVRVMRRIANMRVSG